MGEADKKCEELGWKEVKLKKMNKNILNGAL